MDDLIEGYRRFRREIWPAERARYEALANWGQRPETLVVGCSDSRVDPQTIFGAAPGELFVVRNVAGLVPPFTPGPGHHGTSAALEFAVRVLLVSRIVVLGHAQCGGVRAVVLGAPPQAQDFVAAWVDIAREASSPAREGSFDDAEVKVVRLSLDNLLTYPWVEDRVRSGRLRIEGYRFDIHTGVLCRVGPEGLEPIELSEEKSPLADESQARPLRRFKG